MDDFAGIGCERIDDEPILVGVVSQRQMAQLRRPCSQQLGIGARIVRLQIIRILGRDLDVVWIPRSSRGIPINDVNGLVRQGE